ncbi:MAG TPA: MMPL family transporter [Polyangiaceae bacterium]|nr:MMPL family transporter [Polyangiaceae bacterium]
MSWLVSRSRLVLIVGTLLALVTGVRTVMTYANLKSDIEELLPATAPSVLALERARERLPGLRHLGIVVDAGKPENIGAALRFLSDLEQRVSTYPKDAVALVRSSIRAEREFLETFALQLGDPADVRLLREAVEARRRWEISRALGGDLLDSSEDPPPAIPLQQLIDKYAARQGPVPQFLDDRFVSADRLTAVLVIQTASEASGFSADAALLERIQADTQALGFPGAYAPELRMGYAGDVASRVEETRGLVADLGLSSAVVFALVLSVIYWFYRSWAAWPVLLIPVLFGALYTFGLVALPPLDIRYLNSNTAFLASIIVGNGINSGVILLARVQEQLRAKEPVRAAVQTAVEETWLPTLAAALAAGAAYGSLILTDTRGFKQFGWIGGLGMPVCWVATYLLGPPLIRFWGEALGRHAREAGRPGLAERVAGVVVSRPRWVLALSGVLFLGSVFGMVQRRGDWLETDFSRLRRADSFVSGERYWGKRMDATLQRYLTPTVVLTDSAEQADAVATAARELAASGKAAGLIASVRSASDVLPKTRDEALAEAKKLDAALTPSMRAALPPEQRALVDRFLSPKGLTPVTPADVPPALAAGLRDRSGHFDRNVLIFPRLTSDTWKMDSIAEFTRDVRQLVEATAPTAAVTGHLLVSNDIIDAMRRDGPRATAIALGVTLLVVLMAFRSWELSLLAMGSLALGVTLMLGFGAWVGQRLNFTNFIALPITFGIAADYSINVLKRSQSSGNPRDAVAHTGGAVALCSLTTVIGFGSLLVAQNGALFSFGELAVTGELTCLATAVLAIPAYLLLNPKGLRPQKGGDAEERSPRPPAVDTVAR